ncbi:hypothetical protein LX32DRAFT_657968 [Colletotrichum zoysiae]|uniref:Uncharacterized protein n=1 Tax=Colletotrichum zoysiae TaxID=1216348 RepID=A0AAD9H5W6_9PEZI|nr:hypothetical protein LX32DRAFT_657968 [Colletotrichum zoysiae]
MPLKVLPRATYSNKRVSKTCRYEYGATKNDIATNSETLPRQLVGFPLANVGILDANIPSDATPSAAYPFRHYQDNLKNRRCFRIKVYPKTKREILDAALCKIRFSPEDKERGRAGFKLLHVYRVLEHKFVDKVKNTLKLAVKSGSLVSPILRPLDAAIPPAEPLLPSKTADTGVGVCIRGTNADAMTMDRRLDSRKDTVEKAANKTGGEACGKKKQKKKAARQGRCDETDALINTKDNVGILFMCNYLGMGAFAKVDE